MAGVFNWLLAACVSPLRIHRSVGWIQRRTKRLRSDRHRVGVLFVRYLLFCAASLAALRNAGPSFAFPTHWCSRARGFQTLAGVLHFFLDLWQQGLQLLHLLPLLRQGLRALRLVDQLLQLVCRDSLHLLAGRKIDSGNSRWRPGASYSACS